MGLSEIDMARIVCHFFTIQSIYPIQSYLNPQFGVQPKVVEDFVEDMRESREVPFTKYNIADFPWKTQIADDFFWLCGPTLTEFTPWLQMNGRQWDLVSSSPVDSFPTIVLLKSPQFCLKLSSFFPG